VVIVQGDVWWADLVEPRGSEPGFRRPVVVVQGNPLNRSRIATIVCVAVTSNLKWASAPGNVLIPSVHAGLPADSVANVSQIVTLDRSVFSEHAGRLPEPLLQLVLAGIDVVLGR
jgi:mRNA interferase MazF